VIREVPRQNEFIRPETEERYAAIREQLGRPPDLERLRRGDASTQREIAEQKANEQAGLGHAFAEHRVEKSSCNDVPWMERWHATQKLDPSSIRYLNMRRASSATRLLSQLRPLAGLLRRQRASVSSPRGDLTTVGQRACRTNSLHDSPVRRPSFTSGRPSAPWEATGGLMLRDIQDSPEDGTRRTSVLIPGCRPCGECRRKESGMSRLVFPGPEMKEEHVV
jgi:hypothetical protein